MKTTWTPEKIKQLRTEHKLSQEDFGELFGVTSRYIIYLEQGKKTPSKMMQILLDYIAVTLEEKARERKRLRAEYRRNKKKRG